LFWIELLKSSRMYFCAAPMNRHRWHAASTRERETWKNEAARLREYSMVIDRARGVARISDWQVEKYHWIFKEIYWHRRRFSFTFWWPPLPAPLLAGYWRFLAGKLGRRMFKKIRRMLRLPVKPKNIQ
jgi:hypothetical protein